MHLCVCVCVFVCVCVCVCVGGLPLLSPYLSSNQNPGRATATEGLWCACGVCESVGGGGCLHHVSSNQDPGTATATAGWWGPRV